MATAETPFDPSVLGEPWAVLERLEARFNEEAAAARMDAKRYRRGKDVGDALVAATLSTCGDTWECAARAVHDALAAARAHAPAPAASSDLSEAAETVAGISNYLKTALDNGDGIEESRWLDGLMEVHGILLDHAPAPPLVEAARLADALERLTRQFRFNEVTGTSHPNPFNDISVFNAALDNARAALAAWREHGGWREGMPPQDGRIYEVLHQTVMKWKPYSAKAPAIQRRKGGRWQESNGYGGFTNTDAVPVFYRPLFKSEPSDG